MSNRDKLLGALMGAIAGVVTGLLVAPKAGKETREDIGESVGKIKSEMSKHLSKISDITKEKYGEVVDRVVGDYQKNKEISKDDIDELKKVLLEAYEEASKKTGKKD